MTGHARTTENHSGRPRQRRAFVLLLVLGVFVLATATIGWNISRLAVYSRTVEARINIYRDHHEALALRDIAHVWIGKLSLNNTDRTRARELLSGLAAGSEPDFQLVLPEGRLVTFWLSDGQGTLLANLSAAETAAQRELVLRTLERLPADRPDLVRMSGPWQISVRGMDDELISALTNGNTTLETALRDARSDPALEPRLLNARLAERGVDLADHRILTEALTLEPTMWAVLAEATDLADGAATRNTRRYEILIELTQTQAIIHEARRLNEREFNDRRDPPQRAGGA